MSNEIEALLERLLTGLRDGALIYWDPQTARGVEAKCDFIARIDDALPRIQALEASLAEVTSEKDAMADEMRRIAEGNLGDAPWQANYERIREVARAALTANAEQGEG